MRTYFPKQGDIEPRWYVIDAEGKVLGRLSTEIARIIILPQNPGRGFLERESILRTFADEVMARL